MSNTVPSQSSFTEGAIQVEERLRYKETSYVNYCFLQSYFEGKADVGGRS